LRRIDDNEQRYLNPLHIKFLLIQGKEDAMLMDDFEEGEEEEE
jgi:hypothetical protein